MGDSASRPPPPKPRAFFSMRSLGKTQLKRYRAPSSVDE